MLILAESGTVRQVVFASPDHGFEWVDLTAPDRSCLVALIEESGLDESVIEDCIDPHQLPKLEQYGNITFMMLRLHVGPVADSTAGAFGLTQTVAIVFSPNRLLTIHRRDHPVLSRLRRRYAHEGAKLDDPALTLLGDLIRDCIASFETPLERLSVEIQEFEESVLSAHLSERTLEQIFVRKRRASVTAWMLLRTHDVLRREHGQGFGYLGIWLVIGVVFAGSLRWFGRRDWLR